MEVAPREAEEPAKKKQKSSGVTDRDRGLQERVGTLTTAFAEHPQRLRALFKRDTGTSAATKGSQATHPQTCSDFYLEQWSAVLEKPKRIRVDSEGSWMSEAAASFFGKESVLSRFPEAHWQTGSNAREDVRGFSPRQHALGRAPDLDGILHTRIRSASHSTGRTCG